MTDEPWVSPVHEAETLDGAEAHAQHPLHTAVIQLRAERDAARAEIDRLRREFLTVPSVNVNGNAVHLEWVVAGRTLYLTFYDDDTHEGYFDDGDGEDWETRGTSPRLVEAFRKLLARGAVDGTVTR